MNAVSASTRVPIAAPNWVSVLRVILVSSVIGVIVGLTEDSYRGLLYDVVISNAFGISIFSLTTLLLRTTRGRIGIVPALCIAAPAGMLLGARSRRCSASMIQSAAGCMTR